MVKQRQAIGIIGMAFAVGGGILWFLGDQYHLVALILWGVAIIIILKLGGKRKPAARTSSSSSSRGR